MSEASGATRRKLLSPVTCYLIPATLGAASVASFAPLEQFWLLPLTLAALFHLLQSSPNWQQAFCRAFAFGLGYFLVGVSWVYVSMSVFGGLPMPLAALAVLLFCVFLALFPAIAGGLFRRFLPATPVRRTLAFAAALTLADLARGYFLTGFPWLAFGYSQTAPSPLVGFAPLVGVYGLGFLAAFIAAAIACALQQHHGRWGVSILVMAFVGWVLSGQQWTQPAGDSIRVALVQGNVAQDVKWQPEHTRATLNDYLDLVARHPAKLTVLPETALPVFFDTLPQAYLQELARLAKRQQGDLLLGVPTRTAAADSEDYWNAAISLGVSPNQHYAKSHLVPFGEYAPPGFDWFLRQMNIPMANFSSGSARQPALHLAGQRVALNICYEDLFGNALRATLPDATLLVNMSNTAWFGHSLAQSQHLQIARLRALETGRPMLRATNTGVTAIIAPDGSVVARLPEFESGVLTGEVQGYTGLTPYARWGDMAALLLALGALAWVWQGRAGSKIPPS
ncbi:apolipoprotein N-acyltransferase [Betaproteobacteria bacterium]|nr:apolipoprotein N-acyltransferase [Betaproteobacteria bacterium]GHU44487.1 apolipoprotein N-acyltransferase [Betaproteobacteria bacterium]